jgi:magnesium transporter
MSYIEKQTTIRPAVPVALVRKLLHRGARTSLARIFAKAYPVEVARTLSLLGQSERFAAFSLMLEENEAEHVAAVLREMSASDSLALLQKLEPRQIANLLNNMPVDDATYLASQLPEPLASQVLGLMEAQPAAEIRELLEHEERTAGRIMTPDYFALEEDVTVSEAIAALQRRSEEYEMVFYLYVVDKRNHLVGVVSLRKLLTTPPSTQLHRIMTTDVIYVKTDTPQEEVARLVAQYDLLAIPVVDDEDRLVGIVTVDDVIDVLQEEAAEDMLALAGVSSEERIKTPMMRSLQLRAPWLVINLATAFLASFVIKQFTGTIETLPDLAALVSIPMGMGGNAATQTLTVVVRGLALNEVTSISWVALKEAIVGAGNGLINGLICAVVVAISFEKVWLGAVLAIAMVINLVVAGLSGLFIPVVLKKLRIDPAVASTVFVTTCTDVAGSFSFLMLATLLIRLLVS